MKRKVSEHEAVVESNTNLKVRILLQSYLSGASIFSPSLSCTQDFIKKVTLMEIHIFCVHLIFFNHIGYFIKNSSVAVVHCPWTWMFSILSLTFQYHFVILAKLSEARAEHFLRWSIFDIDTPSLRRVHFVNLKMEIP